MALNNECADPTSYLKLVKLHTAISSIRSYPRLQPTGLKCIERILEQDGDINYQIPNTVMLKSRRSELVGCTILYLHFYYDENSDILNLLLDHGADFTIKNSEGQTVIHDYYINTISWKLREDSWSSLKHPLGVTLVLSAHFKHRITENPIDPNGFSHFHAACMTNNVEAIKFFLNKGVSIDQRVNVDSPVFAGYTPLHFATRFDCLEAVELLLLRGAKIDVQDTSNVSPLHLIIFRILRGRNSYWMSEERFDVVEEMVKNYEIHDAQDHFGLSHLHALCTLKDSSRLERHLDEFENVNCAVNADSPFCPGYTPLHFAAQFNLDSLKLLLARDGDIMIENTDKKTPLDLCIARYGIEDIHDIIARSTFKNVTLSNGKTKLTDVIHSMRSLSNFQTFLHELGDVNAHIPLGSALWPGHTPLHLAIVLQDIRDERQRKMLVQMTEECLENDVNVETKSAFDQTLLQFAFQRARAEVVDLMLKYHVGASNPVDADGLSHLHIACATESQRMVRLLLKYGANVNCKLGSSVEWYSKSKMHRYFSHNSRTRILLPDGSTPLHVAVAVGDNEMARLLLNRGANRQVQDADGMSVVHRLMLSDAHDSWELLGEMLSSSELHECVAESYGLSHLHVACYRKDLDAVKKLLLEPESQVNRTINCKTTDSHRLTHFDGYTPLSMAMYFGDDEKSLEVVKLLLRQGADILTDRRRNPLFSVMDSFNNNKDYYYWDLFATKIRSDEDLRRRLVERVPGLTDLHLACYGRDLRWIGELLAMGVDVNARIRDESPIWSGYTPLHVLVKRSANVKEEPDTILQLLLDNGADVGISDGYDSNTPLHLAENWSHRYADCYRMVTIETEDCRGLNRVKKTTLPVIPCDRTSLMLRSIKDFTSNPTNIAGVSHFHIACWCLDVVAVDGFLKHSVDVNAKMDYFYNFMGGYTPLHVTLTREASSPRKKRIVQLLLKHGADIRAESYSGNTALHYAAMYYANIGLPIFTMIFDAGGDINARNVLGATPLEILLKEGKVSIEWMKYFIERGCRINDFNCVSDEGLMPMIFAARKLKKQNVKTLLLNSPNIGELDEMGRSAIHNIVSTYSSTLDVSDYAKLIEGLENLGCDVDHQDKSGQTALHVAARFQNDRAISALLEAGADINVVDGFGKTAFAYSLLERRVYKSGRFDCQSEYDDVLNREAVELFAAHVRKLELAGLHVDALNVRSREIASRKICFFKSMDGNHFRAMLHWVDNVKVGSQSLRDFVSANGAVWKYSKLRWMNREHVVELFDAILDKRYGNQLGELQCLVKLQYRNYLMRPRLVEEAKSALNALANISVPDLCSEAILVFCANWELRSVVEATT